MAKSSNGKNLPAVNADTLNKIHNGTEEGTIEQALEHLEKSENLIDLSSEYFKFEKKGVFHFAFMGLSTITMDDEVIDVVQLRDKEGNNFVNGDKVLVSSCRRITTIPAYIRVNYAEDKKSGNGTYKDLKVQTLAGATA